MTKQEYDYVIFSIGYSRYVMPRKAAYTLFDACQGQDIYKFDTEYDSTTRENRPLVKEMTEDTVRIEHIGPGVFHRGRVLWQEKQEEERKKQEMK